MKIIVTTSDKYLHILPIFTYLFNKYWGGPCEIVGYNNPDFELPDNFSFHSMGKQGSVNEWSTDLRKYFDKQDGWFIWMMEDTFIKAKVRVSTIKYTAWALRVSNSNVGRFNLTNEVFKQDNEYVTGWDIRKAVHTSQLYKNTQTARYRLSTQPSIWNKEFLLKYMTNGLTPWDFETQHSINDGWEILGVDNPPLVHNEGVRRFDIRKYNLDGMCQEDIDYINSLG